jgi:hypothetical protein
MIEPFISMCQACTNIFGSTKPAASARPTMIARIFERWMADARRSGLPTLASSNTLMNEQPSKGDRQIELGFEVAVKTRFRAARLHKDRIDTDLVDPLSGKEFVSRTEQALACAAPSFPFRCATILVCRKFITAEKNSSRKLVAVS